VGPSDAFTAVREARHWAYLASGSTATVAQETARLERLGVTGALVPQILAPPWATLGAAAASSRLELASGIALAFVRSPLETAMAAIDVDRLSGGRFTLGLGTSVRAWNEDRFGVAYDHPVERVRELLTIIRPMLSADGPPLGAWQGRFYSFDLTGVRLPRPSRERVPIWLAPLRAAMVELSAELGDGLLGHPAWSPQWIKTEVQTALERGLSRAGRSRHEIRVVAFLRAAINDDEQQAIDDAKRSVPTYAQLGQYESYFARHGFEAQARTLQQLSSGHAPLDELAAVVPDEMARQFLLVGTPDDVARELAVLLPYVDDVCITAPMGLSRERTAFYQKAIETHLLPSPGPSTSPEDAAA
jgi:alkanesulfonate monooxygenase SsuD/methylene tetrahydromethanopterin reductase-like flavin-dependent oxidoreductase (luciferase family)